VVENAGDEKYAGSDYVKCSPYHIVAIFSQLTAFAKAGAGLLAVAGTDALDPAGSTFANMLPHFLADFVGTTFRAAIVEDSNRICSIAVQGAGSFLPPRAPSRLWQHGREPLQSCLTVAALLRRLYGCARAMPAHGELFKGQATALTARYVLECRRQIDLGGRGRVAYDIVCPSKRGDGGGAVSAAALVDLLQTKGNAAWGAVLWSRRCGASGTARGGRPAGAALAWTSSVAAAEGEYDRCAVPIQNLCRGSWICVTLYRV
jgi:hypothetical protein